MNLIIRNQTDWKELFCLEDAQVLLRTVPGVADAYWENEFPAVRTPDLEVVLRHEDGLEEGAWLLQGYEKGMSVSAADPDGLSAGIYALLEKLGFRFEIGGPVIPDTLTDLGLFTEKTVPAVRLRGPRLHVNFPMDISAFSLTDAKKYVRNLARLKFNSVTFHSYAGQWTSPSATDHNVGGYFYGHSHKIPKNAVLREKIHNDKLFCMPEAEPYYQDPEQNSRIARWWMREVTRECVRVGLRVAFSYEPAGYEDPDVAFSVAEEILREYPSVSVLELMTMEMVGGLGYQAGALSEEKVREEIVRVLGEAALTPECTEALKACPLDKFIGALGYVEFNLKLQKKLAEAHPELPVQIGIYVPDPPVLSVLYPALENGIPQGQGIAYLPNYGSKRTSDTIRTMSLGKPDTKRTTYYTWAECDGDMFTAQNHCTGLYELVNMLWKNDPEGRAYSVHLNHWRVEECADDLRYFSECTVDPSLTPEQHHLRTATYYGIAEPEVYCESKMKLDRASYSTGILSFCYVDCWFTENDPIASPGGLSDPVLGQAFRTSLEECRSLLEKLYDASDARAKAMLRFDINRLEISLLHVDASLELTKILADERILPHTAHYIWEMPKELREEVTRYAENAEFFAKKYLIRYAEVMPDRTSEGMLASYYKTMLFYIDHIKNKFSEIPMPENYRDRPLNPPPMPGGR